jgi:hypothetical protein
VFFQTLDDKTECVGLYSGGTLYFKDFPTELTKTWRYTGSITDPAVEYAWLFCNGFTLAEVCPDFLKERLESSQRRFRAYLKSFEIGRIRLREHCFFDLVPEDFLLEFCDVKNEITKFVFENYEKPENYDHLNAIQKLLYKIKYQNMNINVEGCRKLYQSTFGRKKASEIMKRSHYIDYNLFGAITGRLTTNKNSLPILTMKKEFRQLLKPQHDWFISLDYNGAEVRTFLDLSGKEQPQDDIHEWNIKHVIKEDVDRFTAKQRFFSWLYNPDSTAIKTNFYNKEKLLDKWYEGGYIITPYKRKMKVERRKALNYLIQSTTADRVLERAVVIDKMLEDKKSFISHIVHDEIVIDLCDEERGILPEIKKVFEKDGFMANINAGKNYLDFDRLKI